MSGEDVKFGTRPAISGCRCVRHASASVFSVPVLTSNQGAAPSAVDEDTVDATDMPENGEMRVSRDRCQDASRLAKAGLRIRRARRRCSYTSPTERCHIRVAVEQWPGRKNV